MISGDAGSLEVEQVLSRLDSTHDGLSTSEAAERLARLGPNAVVTHHARALGMLARQVRSPLLVLLVSAATVSFFVGEQADAVIIGVIVSL